MNNKKSYGMPAGKKPVFQIKSGITAGNITIYGSPNCGWTMKQLENFELKGIPFEFVDCTMAKGDCPGIVEGFPTTVISGFREF